MPETIRVTVAYADPESQIVRAISVAADACVDDAIRSSGIAAQLPAGFTPAALGIFGRTVKGNEHLRDGDRIELLRPLKIDPKEARRRRAGKR